MFAIVIQVFMVQLQYVQHVVINVQLAQQQIQLVQHVLLLIIVLVLQHVIVLINTMMMEVHRYAKLASILALLVLMVQHV